MEFATKIMSNFATAYKVSSLEMGGSRIHKVGRVIVLGVRGTWREVRKNGERRIRV
jgi:hypothetical protein